MCRYRGREYRGPSDAAQLAPEDIYLRGFTIHYSLERTALLDTSGGQVGDPCRQAMSEKLPPEPRRHHRGGHGLGVFQYNCESLQAPDRLCELTALAKGAGADVACLQGTLFDGVGEWTKHGYHFFSLNHSGPRQKDGCMIAVNTTIPRTQIRCVHHWMSWTGLLAFGLQCGVERNAGDVYFISAYAPVHDERTQTPTSQRLFQPNSGENSMESSVRVPKQVPEWFCVWTPMEKWKQHFLGLEVPAAEFVKGAKNGS